MRGLGLRRRLAALYVVVAAALVALGVLASMAISGVEEGRDRVMVDLFEGVDAAGTALRAAQDQESALAGALAAGDPAALDRYDRAEQVRERAEAEVLLRLEQEPEVQEGFSEAQALGAAWREELAAPAAQALRAGEPVPPEQVERVRLGFERFEEAHLAAREELSEYRLTAVQDYDDAFTSLRWALRGTLALILVVAVLLWQAQRRWVVAPIEDLAAQTRAVAAGDLSRHVSVDEPLEVARLSADVDAMRRRIVDELHEVAIAGARLEEANAALEAQATDLRRSNAELEQFAYVASHDLQEPLRKVASFTQMLQRRYEGQLDDRADQYIAFAVDGAKRMQQLINDLLAFSRVGRLTNRWTDVDLDDALRQALTSLSTALEETEAVVDVEGDLPVVRGEPGLLVQVLQNLVGNAVKFRRPGVPPRVVITCEQGDGEHLVAVRDNGIGISPQYAEKVFVIFQRLHPREEYEGSGIGLALSRKVVEYHGGRMWVDVDRPDDDPGTTIRFALPVATAVAEPGAAVPGITSSSTTSSTTTDREAASA